jgi:hypothetical protein
MVDTTEIALLKSAIMSDKRIHESLTQSGYVNIAKVVNAKENTNLSAEAIQEVLLMDDFIKNIRKNILSVDKKLSDLQTDDGTTFITSYITTYLKDKYMLFTIDNNYINYAMNSSPQLRETALKSLEKKINILRGLFP